MRFNKLNKQKREEYINNTSTLTYAEACVLNAISAAIDDINKDLEDTKLKDDERKFLQEQKDIIIETFKEELSWED